MRFRGLAPTVFSAPNEAIRLRFAPFHTRGATLRSSVKNDIQVAEDSMRFRLKALLTAILCVSLACGAVFAQAQASQSGPLHFRFGPPMSRTNAQPTSRTNHPARSTGSSDISFTFGMIDFPGQMYSAAYGVNDSGKIVGTYGAELVGGGEGYSSFLLEGTKFTKIAYPGAVWTGTNSINDSGAIVGDYGVTLTDEQGFELAGGTYTTINYPGAQSTSLACINQSGDIAGVWEDSNGVYHGFLLSQGVFTSFDPPGATLTGPFGINKTDEIVGYYGTADGDSHGFLYSGGTFTTIDYPGSYSQNYLGGINDRGVITGGYGEPTVINGITYNWQHGFIYQNGQFTSADVPFGPPASSQPFAINNNGVVVGEYIDNSDTIYGYEAKVAP